MNRPYRWSRARGRRPVCFSRADGWRDTAIFDRYNYLRQSAMEETLAHTQRNLALSQRLSALEERYEQVTT